MQEIKVTGDPVTIHDGAVRLTDDQARRRALSLEEIADSRDNDVADYKVLKKIQFKAGETFGFDGDVKRLPREVRPPAAPKAAGKGGGANPGNAEVKNAARKSRAAKRGATP